MLKHSSTMPQGYWILSCIASAMLGSPTLAVVLPFTSATFSPDPSGNVVPNVYDNTTLLTSYTTSAGTVTDLSHAISAFGRFEQANNGSNVRNSWGSAGAEIDGPYAALNLDISTGLVNAGDATPASIGSIDVGGTGSPTANFMYSQAINAGLAGNGNDFFLFENGANDTIDILPLDASGAPIGDFVLTIADTDWGPMPFVYSRSIETVAPADTTVGGVAFDLEDFQGTGTLTGVHGLAIGGDAGLDMLIVGVNSALAPAPTPTLTIDRLTGAATLSNEGSAPLNLLGYSITSASGALISDNWTSVADAYDQSGSGVVDNNENWTELTAPGSKTDVSEFAFGIDGGTLAAGQSIDLSTASGLWLPQATEEITGQVMLTNGSVLPVTVVFTGNSDLRLSRSDLDHDGDVDASDYVILRDNYRADFSALTLAEQRLAGDIDGSGVNDLMDFSLFVDDFELANGAGSFAAMLSGNNAVPEPGTFALIAIGALMLVGRRQLRFAVAAIALCVGIAGGPRAYAVVIATEDFESYTPVVGDPGVDFGESGENGGTGWTSAWVEDTNPISSLIRSDLISGYGQGLEIKNRGSSDNNILTRQFPTQSSDFYVGFTMSTNVDNGELYPDANTFIQYYFTDSTAGAPNTGYGGGTNRDPANFYAHLGGGNTPETRVTASTLEVFDNTYDVVFKFSKSGTLSDGGGGFYYDGVDMWINQSAEGTPDVSMSTTNNTLALHSELSTFHVWFDPRNMSAPDEGNLQFDNLVVGTTYDDARFLIDGGDPPPTTLEAVVDTVTGQVRFENNTASAISFKAYELLSNGDDTLTPGNWSSLSSQSSVAHPIVNPVDGDDPGSTAGDGLGEAWDVAGTPSASSLAEEFLLGSTTLSMGQSISLGSIYDTSAAGDLIGQYYDADLGGLVSFEISYVESEGLPGDFNNDGTVDAADYTVWRNNLGSDESTLNGNGDGSGTVDIGDYSTWKSNFGSSVSAASLATPSQVPEPASTILAMALALGIGLCGYRQRKTMRSNVG